MRNLSTLLSKKIKITNDQLVNGKIPDELLKLITDDVTELDLSNCSNLTTLPALLPQSLQKLDLRDCTNLTALPALPQGLQLLFLGGCSRLTTLPSLPQDLKYLYIKNCTSLTTLPDLPQGLQKLALPSFTNLTTLPELPHSLQMLALSNCNNLSIESIAKLEALEEVNRNNTNFILLWPENLSQNSDLINFLKESYKKFYSSNPVLALREPDVSDQLNYPTLFLFQRFTSESLGVRGKREVIAQAKLLAEEIKKNPEILEILDQKSTNYLQACINQPVSGFAEIASLMAIAKEEDIAKKIEKAKILYTQQLIKNKIRSLRNSNSQEVGVAVEVELGNAMLREVYKKLNEEKFIKEPWLGIPSNIAYEESIQSFLTPQNIQEISNLVKEALSDTPKSQKDAIEFLCGVETNFWAKTILTKEEREQTQHKTPEEKVQQEAHLIAQQKRIEELREEIIDLDLSQTALISQKNTELEEIEKDIENKQLKDLPQILEKKTRELLDRSQQSARSRSPSPIGTESLAASGLLGSPRSRT